jgi:hypothetical protein
MTSHELDEWKDVAQRKAFALEAARDEYKAALQMWKRDMAECRDLLAAARRENATLRERLSVAECYIPSRDFGDYQGDADRAALAASPAAEEPQP